MCLMQCVSFQTRLNFFRKLTYFDTLLKSRIYKNLVICIIAEAVFKTDAFAETKNFKEFFALDTGVWVFFEV